MTIEGRDRLTFAISAGFGVVPELVYEALTDPGRLSRCLPSPFFLDSDGANLVTVRRGVQSGPVDGAKQRYVAESKFAINGGNRTQPWNGVATIVPELTGSRLDVTCVAPDCAEEDFAVAAARLIGNLRQDIADSFTPG